jgi:hypothetical protein
VTKRIEALRSTKALLSLVFIDASGFKMVLLFYVFGLSSYVLGLAIYIHLFIYFDSPHYVTNILFFSVVSFGEFVLIGYLSVILLITLLDTEHIAVLLSDLNVQCMNGTLTAVIYGKAYNAVKSKTTEASWIVDFSVLLCIISMVACALIIVTEENQPLYMLANVAVLSKGIALVMFVLFRAAAINDKVADLTRVILRSNISDSVAQPSSFVANDKWLLLSHAVVDPITYPVTGYRVTTKALTGLILSFGLLLAFGIIVNLR